MTLSDLDGRTRARQWAEDKRDEIIADLGGADRLSTLELLQVENAAIDAAVLRDMQMRWLRGEDIAPAAMATTENTFNRTAEALGTKRRARDVSPKTIREQLIEERRQRTQTVEGEVLP